MFVSQIMRNVLVALSFFILNTSTFADTYPLDDIPRQFEPDQSLPCAKNLIKHRSKIIKYSRVMSVNPHFSKKLSSLEKIASKVGIEVFGRSPTKIKHFGGYKCRRIRRFPTYLSEHGLGNAIDLVSFYFPSAPKKSDVARKFSRPFHISVEKHWNSNNKKSLFLKRFVEELIKAGLFRTMLGPAYPGHDDHFHFDMSPYEIISI